MRVVLDVNVVIAAFAARGLCEVVFESCLRRHHLVTCDALLAEIGKGLRGKLRLPADITVATLGVLRDTAESVVPAAVEPGSCRDASDEIVLGVAVAGRADGNVSGDKDLLTLGRFHSVRIVTPREYWEAAQEG